MLSEVELIARLTDAELPDGKKVRVIRKLRRSGIATAASVPVLTELASSPDRFVSLGAIRALGPIGTPEAIQAIRAGLFHPDDYPVVRAAEMLWKLKALDAIPDMIAALAAGQGNFTSSTCESTLAWRSCSLLRRRPDPAAVPVIAPYVTHPNRPVYKSCAAALGTIGTPEAIAALERGLEQGDRKTRREIKSVLAGNFPRWKDEDRSRMPADSRVDAAEIRPPELD